MKDPQIADQSITADKSSLGGEQLFGRVAREPSLADKVSEMMLDVILSEQLKAGDKLPSERELGEQFGVSRTVVREAVRGLAARGVVEVRSGAGLRVAAVDASSVSESLQLFLRGGGVDYPKVDEVRHLLEVRIAGVAARCASDADLDALRAAHARMVEAGEDVEAAVQCDLDFHRAIAAATHNDLYLILMDSIGSYLVDIRRENLRSGYGSAVLLQHEDVLEQIAAHNVEGAEQAMAKHLVAVADHWAEQQREK